MKADGPRFDGPLPARRSPGVRGGAAYIFLPAHRPPSAQMKHPPCPAEVAAPSKRGPSAFILALLTELSSAYPPSAQMKHPPYPALLHPR